MNMEYSSQVDSTYLRAVDSLTSSIRCFGHAVPDRPLQVSPVLSAISAEVKQAITQSLNMYLDVISTPLPAMSDRKLDLAHFDIFCRVAGLRLGDPAFMNDFAEGDICEIYSATHQQLFRNLEFFKFCSYDLFTLTALPWNYLFQRPAEIEKLALETAERTMRDRIVALPSPVPPHLMKECYAGHSKQFIHAVKKGGCLFDSVTRESKGYVTIIKVDEVTSTNTEVYC